MYLSGRERFLLGFLTIMLVKALTAPCADAFAAEIAMYSENMPKEELQEFAAALYTMEIKTPISLEDVRRNDSQRLVNLWGYVPTRAARQKVLPYFCAIPRPACENEIILREITTLLADGSDDKYRALRNLLPEFEHFGFCTTDARLYSVLRDLVLSQCYMMGEKSVAFCALKFLGCIHRPECIEFLSRARRSEYWERETQIKTLQGTARYEACCGMLLATIAAIEHLSPDTSIPLLEEMYTWPSYFENIRHTILYSLDQLWQKKKGEYHLRGEIGLMPWGGWAVTRTDYPAWLYGPGGKRIDRPFGFDPNKTEEQRTRDAEALTYYQKMYEDRAEEAFRNAEAERKKKAQEEAVAPK